MKPQRLKTGDTLGVVAPSRPIIERGTDFKKSVAILEHLGFKIKFGKNIRKRLYYSAGTPQEKADDLNRMFRDPEIKAIICATGGSSSNQTLNYLDWNMIKKNPKIILGYSDITTLLLSFYKKTGMVIFHGPTLLRLSKIDAQSRKFLFDLLSRKEKQDMFPDKMEILRHGNVTGKLIGGNLMVVNSLLGSQYSPNYKNAILFWEELGESPAMIDFRLDEFKLSGNMEKLPGMIIGFLSKCKDKKHPEDNRSIKEIVLEITKEYKFPIIKVDYFGHDIKNFYAFPIGTKASINTKKKEFKLLESVVK